MANTTQNKTAKSAERKKTEKIVDPAAEAVGSIPETVPAEQKVDETQYVTVRNGFHGNLVYISKRTGERFDWPEYGDEQEMELRELKGAKSSQKTFFTENWFLLDDWVVQYLGVEQYYKHAVDRRGIDRLLRSSPDKIAEEIAQMSSGQRETIVYRAKEMIESGEIDSLRMITALEKALGTDLIEK